MAIRYIFAGNLRVAQVKGSTRTYFHKDHLGSSAVMTNSSGNQIESTNYMPFGGMRAHSGTTTSNYKFTDQELDAENGLYNYDARMYDPIIGRFISPDTIVPEPYNPQSLNRYTYCLNNPLIYTDPSGHNVFSGITEEVRKILEWLGLIDRSFEKKKTEETKNDGFIILEEITITAKRDRGDSRAGGGSWGHITYINDNPNKPNPRPEDLTKETRGMIEDVIKETDFSVNVNSGLRINGKPRHSTKQGIDINRIDGKRVDDPSNQDKVQKLQEAFNAHPNIRENYGPQIITKTLGSGVVVDRSDVTTIVNGHKNHIHVSGQE